MRFLVVRRALLAAPQDLPSLPFLVRHRRCVNVTQSQDATDYFRFFGQLRVNRPLELRQLRFFLTVHLQDLRLRDAMLEPQTFQRCMGEPGRAQRTRVLLLILPRAVKHNFRRWPRIV